MRGDLEQLRSQQEQVLGTLDARIDAMLERRTQAIMDRLDGLLGNKCGSWKKGANSTEARREPRVNFNEHPNRGRIHKRNSSSNAPEIKRPRTPTNIRRGSTGSRTISIERPMRNAKVTGRGDSTNWNPSNQGRAQPSDSDKRENPEPQKTDINDQAGKSREA